MFSKTGTHYVPHSPASQRPDIPSPLYPDRPIRPLPKYRLRSRLSPDVADSILHPPAPSERTSLFHFPYNNVGADRVNGVREGADKSERDGNNSRMLQQLRQTSEIDLDSDEEEIGARARRLYHGQSDYSTFNGLAGSQGLSLSNLKSQDHSGLPAKTSPNSNSSSVDGYDSFENTKNKKKRKIPTPRNASNHHTHLSADLANLGISSNHGTEGSSPEELSGGTGQYYSSGYSASSGNGSSGAGRGRLSRSQLKNGSTRSPLGVSTDGSNAWGNGRNGKLRSKDWNVGGGAKGSHSDLPGEGVSKDSHPGTTQKNERGIISAAIANAVGEGLKLPGKDQANISLFQQQPARKPIPAIPRFEQSTAAKPQFQQPTPTKPQFTFTAASDVAWPGGTGVNSGGGSCLGAAPTNANLAPQAIPSFKPQIARDMATQGTQTSPKIAVSRRPAQALPAQGLAASQHAPSGLRQGAQQQPNQVAGGNQPSPSHQHQQQQDQPKKTQNRRNGKEYVLAARQRRLRQEYENYHHPPSSDEIWICEFCEYESIFGTPPEALIRQYEIKDRKERRRLAEKRRLLEKAKMKGRKGKKGGKGTTKGSTASTPNAQQQPNQHQHQHQHHVHDHTQMQSQGTQSEEYLPDEFLDEEEVTIPLADIQVPVTTAATGKSLPPMAPQAKVPPQTHTHTRGVLSQQPNVNKLGAATTGGDMIKAK